MVHLQYLLPNAFTEMTRNILWAYRRATWKLRPLPDFIIIGAQKAGTTSLFSYLKQHPQLSASFTKEVHYFDGGIYPYTDTYEKGESWYRSHFPLTGSQRANRLTFEASPLYIYHPWAAQRMAKRLPDIKLIALLRNPVERAISHYFMEQRAGDENLSIEEALEQEEQRLADSIAHQNYKNHAFLHRSYKKRGLYYEQLKRYRQYYEADQMFIRSSDFFFNHTEACLREIYQFLGVDPTFTIDRLKPQNVATNKSKVSPEVYQRLEAFFEPHNRQLYTLVGKDFGW